MDARKAVLVSQGFTLLAMLLLVSTRIGDAPGNAPRLFGVDSLLVAAVVVLVCSMALVTYALQMGD